MALVQEIISFISVLVLCMTVAVSARGRPYTTPKVKSLTNFFSQVRIDKGFSTVFGLPNIKLLNNGSSVNLALDKNTGSGLASKNRYDYGFFSTAMKLPSGLCPGVVVAFYLSNADKYPHNHDEIDIEILGHDKRYTWVIQTNVYVNGSSTGREEKFYFWFDPTKGYHHYSIIWNNHHTVFLIDNIPVREFVHSSNFPSVYPSKAMSLYATIWDGSEWATHGGKYPVNYKNAPFVVSFAEMQMTGCVSDADAGASASDRSCSMANPSSLDPVDGQEFAKLSTEQVSAMDWARRKLMFYSYCNDKRRFKVMPPECK